MIGGSSYVKQYAILDNTRAFKTFPKWKASVKALLDHVNSYIYKLGVSLQNMGWF